MDNINELKDKILQLEKENKELKDLKEAYIKKTDYLKKELDKATGGKKHMSGPEVAADLALMLCAALLITIFVYVSENYGEGFFELIRNAFTYIFR